MYNLVSTLAPLFLIGSSSYLQVKRKNIISQISLNFGQVLPRNVELATLWCLKIPPKTYNGGIVLNTLAPSFLIGSSSLLQDMHISLDEIEF